MLLLHFRLVVQECSVLGVVRVGDIKILIKGNVLNRINAIVGRGECLDWQCCKVSDGLLQRTEVGGCTNCVEQIIESLMRGQTRAVLIGGIGIRHFALHALRCHSAISLN